MSRPPLSSGGGSVVVAGEELWAVGGGDGEAATGLTQELSPDIISSRYYSPLKVMRRLAGSGEWGWGVGPLLNRPRFAHCTIQVSSVLYSRPVVRRPYLGGG